MEGGSFGKCAADATCGQQTVGVLAAAAAYFFGTGVSGLWPLAWIAPIPVLVLSYRSSARQSATIAFVAYVFANLNIASYLVRLAAPPAVIGAPVASAAPFLLAVLVQRYAILQGKDWSGALVFPAAWTSYEFLMSLMAPDGTALNLAYSQAGALPLVQLASVTGIWGISFLVTLIPAGMAAAWHWRGQRRLALAALGVPICLGLMAWSYGWARVARSSPASTLRVGAATIGASVRLFDASTREQVLPLLVALLALACLQEQPRPYARGLVRVCVSLHAQQTAVWAASLPAAGSLRLGMSVF